MDNWTQIKCAKSCIATCFSTYQLNLTKLSDIIFHNIFNLCQCLIVVGATAARTMLAASVAGGTYCLSWLGDGADFLADLIGIFQCN